MESRQSVEALWGALRASKMSASGIHIVRHVYTYNARYNQKVKSLSDHDGSSKLLSRSSQNASKGSAEKSYDAILDRTAGSITSSKGPVSRLLPI